jgi:hypothetical protein
MWWSSGFSLASDLRVPGTASVAKRSDRSSRFVADGRARARLALEPMVRAQVEQEYRGQLQQAGFWQRFWIRRKVEREIERRIAAAAPPDALY